MSRKENYCANVREGVYVEERREEEHDRVQDRDAVENDEFTSREGREEMTRLIISLCKKETFIYPLENRHKEISYIIITFIYLNEKEMT